MMQGRFASAVAGLCLALLLVTGGDAQDSKTEAPLPPRAVRRFGTTLLRHGSRIQCLHFAPKGGTLIAGGGNDPIRLWDYETGQLERVCPEPWAASLVWNPRERQFAAGGAFRTVRLWNPYKSEEDAHFDGAPSALRALAYSPNGQHLVAACQDGQLVLYQPGNRSATTYAGHQGEANALAFSPDGKVLASGGADRKIRLWQLQPLFNRLEPRGELKTAGMVHALAYTPDGRSLLSAGDDRKIRVWDAATNKLTHTLEGHEDMVVSLAVRGDGKQLVSGGHDDTIRLWSLDTFRQTGLVKRRSGDADALALSSDGKLLASAGFNNTIRLFDVDSGREKSLGHGPQSPLARCVLCPESGVLAAIAQSGELHTWVAATGESPRRWQGKTAPHVQQDFHLVRSPDGKTLLSGTSAESVLEVWDASTGRAAGPLALPAGEHLTSLTFDAAGTTQILGFRSGLVQVNDWPARTTRLSFKAGGPVGALSSSVTAPVLVGAIGTHVVVWDLPTGQELRRIASKPEVAEASLPTIADIALSPDGKTLAVSGYDGVIRLFDWTTGKLLAACEGHGSVAGQIVFAADGRTFASASHDGSVRLWETYVGQTAAIFKGHLGPAVSVAFAADGRTLYSASEDTTLLAWDIPGSTGAAPADAATLQAVWQELASEDPIVGQRAVWRFGEAIDVATFLGKQIYLVDPARVEQLFADLNSEVFVRRDKATQELERYGRWMEGRLQAALMQPPTLEVKRRLERLLSLLRSAAALSLRQERLRIHRVLSILERANTPGARKVIDDLVRGAPEPELQKEAEASLRRALRAAG